MALVSIAEFARQHGASKQAATKWKARGVLVIREDKVDVEASDRRMFHAGLGRFKDRAAEAPAVNREGSTVNQEPSAPVVDPTDDDAVQSFVDRLLAGDYPSIIEAAQVKENALALKHLLQARKAAGMLVEIETAEAALFESTRAARDAWLNFPTRVGPLIAADLGVDAAKVVDALTAQVHLQLEELGEPEPRFAGDEGGETAASGPARLDAAAEDLGPGLG